MINIGDIVTISPTSSLAFGGRQGQVVDIKQEDSLPLKIRFNKNGLAFGFAFDEVIKGVVKMHCKYCGKEINSDNHSTDFCNKQCEEKYHLINKSRNELIEKVSGLLADLKEEVSIGKDN